MNGGYPASEGRLGLGLGQLGPQLPGPALCHSELRPGGPDHGLQNLSSVLSRAFAQTGPSTIWSLADFGQCTPLPEPWFPPSSPGYCQSQQEEKVESTEHSM